MSSTPDKPELDERYARASNSSNLSLQERVTGDVDMIIAAGWSKNLIGKALLRLRSEYDGTPKPVQMNPRALDLLSMAIAREQAQLERKPVPAEPTEHDRKVAREQAAQWLEHEQKLMLGRLKTLPFTRDLLVTGCRERWKWEDAESKVAAVLMWWLDKTCPRCYGTRFERTGKRGAAKACSACHGRGERRAPCEDEGAQLAVFLDDCVSRSKAQIRRNLRPAANQA